MNHSYISFLAKSLYADLAICLRHSACPHLVALPLNVTLGLRNIPDITALDSCAAIQVNLQLSLHI